MVATLYDCHFYTSPECSEGKGNFKYPHLVKITTESPVYNLEFIQTSGMQNSVTELSWPGVFESFDPGLSCILMMFPSHAAVFACGFVHNLLSKLFGKCS